MLRQLADFLHWFTRWSKLICLAFASLPLWLVYPITQYQISNYGCTVQDWQVVECIISDDSLVQSLNNGLVFSLWGLAVTVPFSAAIYFSSIWGKHMLEIYAPRRRKERPPLFKDEG